MFAPAAWAACSEDADCESGEVCDLGGCVVVATPAPAAEEPPLAIPLTQEPTPLAPPARHPGLSYAESAWNVALRNEIESWILFGLTAYGGLNLVSNITFQDPSFLTLEMLGSGGLLTYGVITSWKGAKAGRSGLSRLGVAYGGSPLEQVAWGAYATSLVSGVVAIVSLWAGQYALARGSASLAVVGALTSVGFMQAESIRTRRLLSETMDQADPSRRVQLTPVIGPTEGGLTFGFAASF